MGMKWGLNNLNMTSVTHRIHGAAIYGNIYHQYTPNVSIYTIHGSYGQYFTFISLTSSQRHATRPQVGDLVGSVKCVEMPEGSKEEIVGLKMGDLTNDIKVIPSGKLT